MRKIHAPQVVSEECRILMKQKNSTKNNFKAHLLYICLSYLHVPSICVRSPEPKALVSFSDQTLFVVFHCRRRRRCR